MTTVCFIVTTSKSSSESWHIPGWSFTARFMLTLAGAVRPLTRAATEVVFYYWVLPFGLMAHTPGEVRFVRYVFLLCQGLLLEAGTLCGLTWRRHARYDDSSAWLLTSIRRLVFKSKCVTMSTARPLGRLESFIIAQVTSRLLICR